MSEFYTWMIKGDEYYDKEEYDKSIEAYNHALEFDMNNVEIWNNLGHAYFNKALTMDQHNEAIKLIEFSIEKHQDALKCDPNNLEAWYHLGIKYSIIEKYEESINAYKKAIKLDPDDHEIWCGLAEAHAMKGNRDEQLHSLEKALEINSNDHNIWRRLGSFYYYVRKDYKKALESLNESLKINSQDASTWILQGHVYRAKNEHNEAITMYKKAIEIEPNHQYHQQYLGIAYNQAKDYKNAIITFKNIIEKNPKNGSVWNYLGISYSIARDYSNAIKAFERSLEYHYKNITVWNNLIRTHLKVKNYTKAFLLCDNVFKIKWHPRDIIYKQQIPKTYDLLSIAYKQTGKIKKSLEVSNLAKMLERKSITDKNGIIKKNLDSAKWKTVLNYEKNRPNERVYERQIEDTIVKNPEILEDGLKLIGRQYKTSVGFIDVLFKDQQDSYVIVELKRGKGSDKVVGQIQRYMAWVSENLTQTKSVRGIIVVKENDTKLNYAIKGSKFPIDVKTFKTEPPIKNNIKYCDNCGAVNRKSAKFCEKCQNQFWMR